MASPSLSFVRRARCPLLYSAFSLLGRYLGRPYQTNMPFPAKLLQAATLFGGVIGMVRLVAAGKETPACPQAQPSILGTCSRHLGMLERCNSIINDKKALAACFCVQDILDGAF